jgi:hypothetical protein
MKTKLTLILTAIALCTPAFAGPSDGAAFALRHAREAEARQTSTAAGNSGPITYVASNSGKGGTVIAQNSAGSTNIALFKSKKSKSDCSSCQAKKN